MINVDIHQPYYEQTVKRKMHHIKVSLEIYRSQLEKGRHLLHERPRDAWSWVLDFMKAVRDMPLVLGVVGGQRAYGLTSETGE